MTSPSTGSRRLVLAVVVSSALVLAAPFVGVIRSQIRAAFPGQFSLIIYTVDGVLLLAAVAAGLARVRERRLMRYGAMTLAIAAAGVYSQLTGSADSAISSVEYFHFIEYGTITFLFYRVWRDRADWSALVTPVVAAFIVGVVEEGFQWFLPARVGELKDVWLNGVAIGCALIFTLGATPPVSFRFSWSPGSVRLSGRALAVGVLALAGFIHVVHLGVENQDSAGVFASRYTAEELGSLDRQRATTWRLAPPLVRPPRFSREDQFMTEGLQHVQARNKAWDAGDAVTAWRENLILERYFPSVLDTPSYVAAAGHRWSVVQRSDAGTRVAGTGTRAFTSRAYPYPIYAWPWYWLWLCALMTATGLWRLTWLLGSRSMSPSSSRS